MEKIRIKDMQLNRLTDYIKELGEGKYRAEQIFVWLHKGVESFDEMTNLSKPLREKLKDKCEITVAKILNKQVSKDGTIKYLWQLNDGETVESVVMKYHHGISICLSTQVGCRMGCGFCASTIGGMSRNLTAGEILDQLLFATKDIGERISNIVLMGMGEPLDNYDNVIDFLRLVNDDKGLNIGYRHISLSTCGIVPRINDLAKEKMPITLSISLHAPTDSIRDGIMPINRKYNIATLMEACKNFIEVTNRRISYEYAMIDNVNDTVECASKLAGLLRGQLCHVNLIPVNSAGKDGFKRSAKSSINMFLNILTKSGINATVRRELGSDISAACGQLKRQAQKEEVI